MQFQLNVNIPISILNQVGRH